MFSCRHCVRLTLDQFERCLSRLERLDRWVHLLLCSHCRAHARQIRGLDFVLRHQSDTAGAAMPRLSPAARVRIAAAIANTHLD